MESGDYSKENVFATDSGWVMRPDQTATGNDGNLQPEVLVCSRGLKSFGLGGPTARRILVAMLPAKLHSFLMGIHSLVIFPQVKMTSLFTHISMNQFR